MKKKDNLKIIAFGVVLIISVVLLFVFGNKNLISNNVKKTIDEKNHIKDVQTHYNKYVKTKNETNLYLLENDKYLEAGKIGKNIELTLNDIDITSNTNYFAINNLDEKYYINYSDVEPIDNLSEKNERYKNYVLFNENVITKETTKFYNEENLAYQINQSYNLPIIMKDGNKIYVEYQNNLLYVLYEEIDSIVTNQNTDKEVATRVGTIVYHFIYNDANGETCDQVICHKMSQVQSHIDYLKSENYFTPTMKEFEMYIDGKIRLPKNSVVITIDDGWFGGNARDIFTKNEMNATIFVITSGYDPSGFITDYVEVHSHSDNLHNPGVCSGGQGGAIKCADRNFLLTDLKTSREKLQGSTVFCYPFYEFNNYSIEVLKEAGFTMAFAGYGAGGYYKMPVGGDKFRIPRYTLMYDSTVRELKQFLNNY